MQLPKYRIRGRRKTERKSCEATAAKEKLGYEKKLAKYTPGMTDGSSLHGTVYHSNLHSCGESFSAASSSNGCALCSGLVYQEAMGIVAAQKARQVHSEHHIDGDGDGRQ